MLTSRLWRRNASLIPSPASDSRASASAPPIAAGALLALMLVLGGCQSDRDEPQQTAGSDAAGSSSADVDWPLHGLNSAETRFSTLEDINEDNVSELGLDWYFDYPAARGKEATPIVIDGTIYTTGSWSHVFAHDAVSGELKWFYNPKVPRDWAIHLCCDVVNRGVAVKDGKVFFGTLDGRLISLNADDGSLRWEVQTTDRSKPYSITGAPRIVKDKVVIGNGGAELGVRGYVSAYNMADGSMAWRFYTVPGNPEDGFENPALEKAAETWGGGAWWEIGGGGTVWDSMAYDPELNLLYVGVGNGAPWNRQLRSPDGGDNLYLSSILALNPDDGSYVWHYQTTPGDSWDYTATQHMILATLNIAGSPRDVIMQAPKNGFFYVLDRKTGELLSADAYAAVTWATHVDLESGRPQETENARYTDGPTGLNLPGPIGGHNWHPMSYNPEHGLVYIPRQDAGWVYKTDENFEYKHGYWNTGTDSRPAALPDDPAIKEAVLKTVRGLIVAWDPVAKEPRWEIEHEGPWNGGILSTAGNLMLQGNARGELVVYRASDGERLWSFDAQTGIVAPPVTYRVDGEQYIAVVAGWGGALALVGGEALKGGISPNRSRLLVFKLGSDGELPPAIDEPLVIDPPPMTASAESVENGKGLYLAYCVFCHGDGAVSGGPIPDLRALTAETHEQFLAIVLGGLHWDKGMVGFGNELSTEQAEDIRAYLIERAHHALSTQQASAGE